MKGLPVPDIVNCGDLRSIDEDHDNGGDGGGKEVSPVVECDEF
jgi:hypothetical protein